MKFLLLKLLFTITKVILANCQINAWAVSSNSVPNSGGKSLEINRCVLRCEKNTGKINAVVDQNGACSCDHFRHKIGNIYLFRQGKTLPERSLIFIPFTSAGNGFKSIGTEDVTVKHFGIPMVFTEDGPQGHLLDRKAMKLLTTTSNYLSYSIPNSLIEKINSNGLILNFWVKFNYLTDAIDLNKKMPIIDFRVDGSDQKLIFWQVEAAQMRFARAGYKTVEADILWHHIAWTMNVKTAKITMRIDEVTVQTNTMTFGNIANVFSNTMKVGHHGNFRADASMFCFLLQEYGDKTDAEVNEAIIESKWACDDVY